MVNYKPNTISSFEFFEIFPDENSARIYLEKCIWGEYCICPFCMSTQITTLKRKGTYRCRSCKLDFTIRVGTLMYRSKISFRKWIYAIYLVCTSRKGISSLQLSKELGITQKSAWFLLQRIRKACSNNSGLLNGIVEIDETYVGGKEKNKHNSRKLTAGRGTIGKVPVFGMRERGGRVKAFPIVGTSTADFHSAIHKHIKKNSVVCTDEHKSYGNLKGYEHLKVKHSSGEYVNGIACTNGIESVWAILKRGYIGTFHHFSVKHLAKYVDEVTFRLNEGNVKYPTMKRIKSLILGMVGKRLSYQDLIKD